jgi:hypothetical protein
MNKSAVLFIALCLLVAIFISATSAGKPKPQPRGGAPPPRRGGAPPPKNTTTTTRRGAATTQPSTSTPVGTVTITGGYQTDPRDNGRPVVLIAAALGVTPEVFRKAFEGVTPSTNGHPTSEEAQKNKAALLKVLGPYGVTNERLDEVSNRYRYMASSGQVWKRTAATAVGIVNANGVVTGVRITNAGNGYSSVPTVMVQGPNGKLSATATVKYTQDFDTNGSIDSITLK